MRQGIWGGAWRASVKGWIIAAGLVAAVPAVASNLPAALSVAEVPDKAGMDTKAQQAAARGLPAKPEGLDDEGWAALQQAIRKVAVQQARLAGVNGAAQDRFGMSVAISGDTALVGASLDDVAPTPTRARPMCTRAAAARGHCRRS